MTPRAGRSAPQPRHPCSQPRRQFAKGRPFGVTLVGILVIIAGITYVISGILAVFNADLRASVGLVILGLLFSRKATLFFTSR